MNCKFTNPLRTLKVAVFLLVLISSYQSNAQCSTPAVGCPGIDFRNFGLNSNNDASTIEYDNFVSGFHTTIVRDANGDFRAWGENIGHHPSNVNSTSNLLSPLVISPENFHNGFTGTPLKAALGSNYSGNVQGVLLTTAGLHVWGREGIVVDANLTTN